MPPLNLTDIYKRLSKHFGHQKWWPAQTPFEVMVGAILTQQTAWRNVEISIKNLKSKGLLEIQTLAFAPVGTIEECVRPSGFYKQKAKRIHSMARYLNDNYGGELKTIFKKDAETLRSELLSLEGIGPETADSIMLYADCKHRFVIDAYTFRAFKRLGMDFKGDYTRAQEFFESNLSQDLELFRNYHALIVELGKTFCKTKPLCAHCPLNVSCQYHKKRDS